MVDIHCHYFNTEVAVAARDLDVAAHDPLAIYGSAFTRQVNEAQMVDRAAKLSVIHDRLRDMDRMGVDIQAISPAPHQYFYFTDPARGAALSRQINEGIANVVRTHPDRFVGLGNVPLQNAQLAIEELDHAVGTLGLRGVEINTNVNGLNLTDPSLGLEPFFAHAERLGALVFLHPLGFSQGQRLSDHYLGNVIGNPLDTSVAIAMLIMEGWVARYPRLKLLAAHGGGYLPQYWGRMDQAWRARADARQHIKEPPSSYLGRFHFDTLTHDAEVLARLVQRWGADHVLLGTDYPYDMGDEDPRAFIARAPGIDTRERELIEGGNAARLLGIGATTAHH